MSKKLLILIAFAFWIAQCRGQTIPAGLTKSQLELINKRLQSRETVIDTGAEKYTSPAIFDSEPTADSLILADSGKTAPGEAPDTVVSLKPYGLEIFSSQLPFFEQSSAAMPPADYQVGPGDNILVRTWGRVELDLNLEVDREGAIFIPKIGELTVQGATLAEIEKILKNSLDKVYSDFQLAVTFGKLRQIRVFVFGEVKRPGGYSVSPLATVLQALYIAGGLTENASMRSVQLVRNSKPFLTYDLYDLLLKGDNSKDLKLRSGDVVYVPVTGPRISISGEVRRPAIYELTESEGLKEALQFAGGVLPTAYLQSITIDRVGETDNRLLRNLNIADIDSLSSDELRLRDGDRLRVPSIYEFHANMVQLAGHVTHPGPFGLKDSMFISDLIAGGSRLKPDAYLESAKLFRMEGDGRRSVIQVNLKKILTGDISSDILLKEQDSLHVFSYAEVTRDNFVYIEGEVARPGRFPLYHNMRLSDLIFLAGNPTKASYLLEAEIARFNENKSTEIFRVNLTEILEKDSSDCDLVLCDEDHVFIRQLPDWKPIAMVIVEGEVRFPGKYALSRRDERLSEIIRRAGGLTANAFPEGSILLRQSIARDISRRNIGEIIRNTTETYLDSSGKQMEKLQIGFDPNQLNRVVIDLPKILRSPFGPEDIAMADSDYLYIPGTPSGVQVIGAAAANGTISYQKNKDIKYYIEQAGGFAPDADRSQVRLVKPNGKVLYGRQAFSNKVALGDAIIVPAKIKRKSDVGKALATAATIVGSMATTVFIVNQLK